MSNIIPTRSKLIISTDLRVYSIIDLILKLKLVIDDNKHIQSNLNTVHSLPIYCTYYYFDFETDTAMYNECLIFYYNEDDLKLVDNVALDKIVDWIKDNPSKVEKLCKLKLFI